MRSPFRPSFGTNPPMVSGRDAVVARSQGGVVDARQWHEQKRQAARASHLRDKLVVTTGGRQRQLCKESPSRKLEA